MRINGLAGGIAAALTLTALQPASDLGGRSGAVGAEQTGATAAVDSGWIAGSVFSLEGNVPQRYANVILVGTTMGAMTDSTGTFLMRGPAGSYTIRAMMMGLRSRELAHIVVTPNDTTRIVLQLEPRGLTEAEARAESVGVDVRVSSDELRCEIIPARERFLVGESASFGVRIHNESGERFYFVRALDGSERGVRYPRVEWLVEGPDGGVETPRVVYCGNLNSLQPGDFVWVEPGTSFDPYQTGGFEGPMREAGVFVKPGRYTVTVRYSTDAGDIRRWLGDWAGHLSPIISKQIRRVPRVVLTASTTIDVEE